MTNDETSINSFRIMLHDLPVSAVSRGKPILNELANGTCRRDHFPNFIPFRPELVIVSGQYREGI